ncbi:hypothetical protein AVEN_68820-1 [Araneus ventricosus]|uniref:Uncharacterized protein n=1 Tax=Araneus ventricosus TaxID=182803 RepID=A0A4Y2C660_ARAVE|nr:hypothetical protein AVEN_68820-1 [Araneus ventricosus]
MSGQQKRQFPILKYVYRVKLENLPKIVVTCVVLDNIAETLGDPDLETAEEAPEENHHEENHHFDNNSFRHQGQEIRKNLSTIINNFE